MTLQEYLVKLGWSVDEPSFKRFIGALSTTASKTAELSSAVIETAGAIELMVSRVARKYETLYYMSQRTSQSVKYIQSTQFAFKQIGLSADEANASIENIATTLRTQPWLRAIFGGASTPQAVADRLGKSGLPYFLQARFAEMIGMDEKTLLHLQKFGAIEEKARKDKEGRLRAAGIDPDKLAKQITGQGGLIPALNKLEDDLEIFGDRMAMDFLNPVKTGILYMDEAVQWLNRVDDATRGWAGTLEALAGTAGGLIILEKILRRLLGLGGKTAAGTAIGLGGKLLGRGVGGGLVGGLASVLGMVKEDNPETKKGLRGALGPLLYELGLSKSPNLSGDSSVGDKSEKAVNALVKAGYPVESAIGIVSGLYSESGLDERNVNPTSGASGIGQWLGSRKAGMGSTFDEQLQHVIDELDHGDPQSREAGQRLKKGGMGSREAAGTFIHGFERPGPAGEVSDMSRAGPLADLLSSQVAQQNVAPTNNITLNSKTDVHVGAGTDHASAAKAYGDAHDDVNDNLVRNVAGAMR